MNTIPKLLTLFKKETKKKTGNPYEAINQLCDLGYHFTEGDLDRYIVFLLNTKYYQYVSLEQFKKILKNSKPTDEQYKKIIDMGYFQIIKHLQENNYQFTDKQLDSIANLGYDVSVLYKNQHITDEIIARCIRSYVVGHKIQNFKNILDNYQGEINHHIVACFKDPYISSKYKLISLLVERMEPNVELLNELLKTNNQINDYDILDLISRFDSDILEKSVFKEGFNLVLLLLNIGVVPNMDTLYGFCEGGCCEVIFDWIISFKVIPDAKCLDLLSQNDNCSSELFEKVYNQGLTPTESNFRDIVKKGKNKIAQLFIKFGYTPSKEDVYLAIENGIFIKELENFGIQYDEDIYYRCHVYDICLKRDDIMKFSLPLNVMEMHLLSGNCNIKEFTEFLNESKLAPDRYCLDITLRHNHELFRHIISMWKCSPSPLSFVLACQNINNYNIRCITKLSSEYIKLHIDKYNGMLEQFELITHS